MQYKIINNSVDATRLQTTKTKAEMYASWGIPVATVAGVTVLPPVAGSYCRISANRRPDAVIGALPLLPPTWHAVLIGEANDPNETAAIRQQIAALPSSIQARIQVLPEDNNSGNVLNAFDVVVSVPPSESFGLTLAEGLWLGKPVVATPTGLAQLIPQYFYKVPIHSGSATLATAILAAKAGGCPAGAQSYIQQTYAPANFLEQWTTLLKATAGVPVPVPSLPSQAASFLGSMAKHVLLGAPRASDEEIARREAICATCPLLVNDRCTSCGCMNNQSFLGLTGLRAKRAMKYETCPKAKW